MTLDKTNPQIAVMFEDNMETVVDKATAAMDEWYKMLNNEPLASRLDLLWALKDLREETEDLIEQLS